MSIQIKNSSVQTMSVFDKSIYIHKSFIQQLIFLESKHLASLYDIVEIIPFIIKHLVDFLVGGETVIRNIMAEKC